MIVVVFAMFVVVLDKMWRRLPNHEPIS